MSWKKRGALVASAILVIAVPLVNGCSSSGGGSASDAGTEGGIIVVHKDAASGSSSGGGDDSGDDGSTPAFDGTVGKACKTDSDCRPPGGPGVNFCSSDALFGSAGTNTLFPTSVCIGGLACNSGSDGNPHFCDGPDAFGSPGFCVPTSMTDPTKGVCLPACTYKPDGSAVTGCAGKDACLGGNFIADPSDPNVPIGVGFCEGGCDTDADCDTAGQHCQSDQGLCLATVTTNDLPVGTGCNQLAVPAPQCNCIAPASGLGFCAQFCKTGGDECAAGSLCDAQLPVSLVSSNDAAIAGWTAPNPGLFGFCSPKCEVDGGAQTEAGTCFPNTMCLSGDLGGPDCLP
jgi:hypothetical protein